MPRNNSKESGVSWFKNGVKTNQRTDRQTYTADRITLPADTIGNYRRRSLKGEQKQ